MTHCLSCFERIVIDIGWKDLFTPRKPEALCEPCRSQLAPINLEKICTTCSRPLPEKTFACQDCLTWTTHPTYHNVLHQNRSLYNYNDGLKDLIKRFKYEKDYTIAQCFTPKLNETIKTMGEFNLYVPIPLHSKRLQERTFNQSEALMKEAGMKINDLLFRKEETSERQAHKAKHARHTSVNPFSSKETLNGETILIVDDLYTTGTTIRHAAWVLKSIGAGKICSLTVGR